MADIPNMFGDGTPSDRRRNRPDIRTYWLDAAQQRGETAPAEEVNRQN